MGIKSGQILYSGGGFVLDRVQTGGVSNLNIPQETIHEVGNFLNTGIVYDIPDLSFEVQSLDVSSDLEALTLGLTPSSVTAGPAGTVLDFNSALPIDIISPIRSAQNAFGIVNGAIIPFLTLEQVAYRFGVRANAEETFTFRGDSVFYSPGTPYYETFAAPTTSYSFAHGPAIEYLEANIPRYAMGVSWINTANNTFQRLFAGQDYTETNAGITLLAAPPTGSTVRVSYFSNVAGTYGANSTTAASNTVKPAALRSKDIDVYIAPQGATPTFQRFTGVQTVDITRRVTLQLDEEFGNSHYISQDYDTPDVNGTLAVRPATPGDFYNKVALLAGVTGGQVAGPLTYPPVQMEIHLYDPADHNTRLKTIYVPDAVFEAPPVQTRVMQKLDVSFKWTSNTGSIQVFKGAR